MYPLTRAVMASDIATMLALDLVGLDREITKVASLPNMQSGALCFSREGAAYCGEGGAIIAPYSAQGSDTTSLIISPNPRLDFIRALIGLKRKGLIVEDQRSGKIHANADVHPTAIIGEGADIGAEVTVGEYSVISSFVSIESGASIGAYTVLGSNGFGFERDDRGVPLRFPHLGRVLISEEVELGSHCCVDRGALEDTVLGPFVKCDHRTYIAHGAHVGASTLIMSGATLNGSSKVGEGCWIGTSAVVKEGVQIGANTTVGMGAVVISDIRPSSTVVGVPARPIR